MIGVEVPVMIRVEVVVGVTVGVITVIGVTAVVCLARANASRQLHGTL